MKQDWITEEAREFAARHVAECELMEEGMPVIIPVDEIIHTDDYPFCGDKTCGCYGDDEAYREFIIEPVYERLLTPEEAHRLYFGENI